MVQSGVSLFPFAIFTLNFPIEKLVRAEKIGRVIFFIRSLIEKGAVLKYIFLTVELIFLNVIPLELRKEKLMKCFSNQHYKKKKENQSGCLMLLFLLSTSNKKKKYNICITL